MNLPDLIVIGAMKAATTSLHYYMNLHPQISMSSEKELEFFIEERNWSKGLEWYKSNFNSQSGLQGETSPNYSDFQLFAGVPERMYATIPEAKLIYLVRDPIERILSHYIHLVAAGREKRSIEQAFSDLGHNDYIWRSLYFTQVQRYLSYYPETSILILSYEDLQNKNQQIMQEIFKFLGVDTSVYNEKFGAILHKSTHKRKKSDFGLSLRHQTLFKHIDKLPSPIRSRVDWLLFYPFSEKITKPVLEQSLRAKLVDALSEDVGQLRKFTGNQFSEWSL